MNEVRIDQDGWYHTRGDDRVGPVTFAELKALAGDSSLNPRLDLVWRAGMPDWKPAGEIEGLFERRTPPPAPESLAPAADPYTPPEDETAAEIMSRQTDWPGARRRSFWFMTIILPFLWVMGIAALQPKLMEVEYARDVLPSVLLAAQFVPLLIGIIFGLKRLVNLGMSRWWFLGNFVPILNFWVGYRTYCCPAGYAFHKKLDTIGLVLAILYWLMIALSLLAVIAAIAVLFGMIGDPELKRQLQEAFEQASAAKQ